MSPAANPPQADARAHQVSAQQHLGQIEKARWPQRRALHGKEHALAKVCGITSTGINRVTPRASVVLWLVHLSSGPLATIAAQKWCADTAASQSWHGRQLRSASLTPPAVRCV